MTNNVRRGLGLLVVAAFGVVVTFIGTRFDEVGLRHPSVALDVLTVGFLIVGLLLVAVGSVVGLILLAVGLLAPNARSRS